MAKWEYKLVPIHILKTNLVVEEILSNLGAEGWELVSVWVNHTYREHYFKRQIIETDKD